MEYVIGIIAVVLIFGSRAFKEVRDYLLKKEQIKADAMLKAEALRLKNEMELERLIQNDYKNDVPKQKNDNEDTGFDDGSIKRRIRY